MNLSLRISEKETITKTLHRVQKDLGTLTYSKTIYKLIERHEPTQKEILQLRATVSELEAKLSEQEQILQLGKQFVSSFIPKPETNGHAKQKKS